MEIAMDDRTKAWISQLAKEAAYRSYILPPEVKSTTSQSRTVKMTDEQAEKEKAKRLKTVTGNVQPPHRYGRKVQR